MSERTVPVPATARPGSVLDSPRFALAQLFRFTWVQVRCCLFAVAVFVGLALSRVLPLPIARYDALLVYALVVTAAASWCGWKRAGRSR